MSLTPTSYVTPAVDVPALTELLDGKYAPVRQLVRKNLAEHADILEDAEIAGSQVAQHQLRPNLSVRSLEKGRWRNLTQRTGR